MTSRSWLIMGALLLAACGDGGGAEQTPTRPIRVTSPELEQLKAASPNDRNFGLWRAIRDNGNRCKRVERSGYQQDFQNLSMWTATCADGRRWAIYIAGNGDTQVRNCMELRQLGLPACREPGAAAQKS